MTSLDYYDNGRYPKHVRTLRTFNFTVSLTSLKIEFDPVIIKHMAVSMQLSTVNNIFKATVLKATQEFVECYPEYRRKT